MFGVWTIYYVRSRLHRGLLSNRILFLVISYSVYAFFACHLHQTQDWSCFKSWARESRGAISEVWPPIECCVWSIEMSNIPHKSPLLRPCHPTSGGGNNRSFQRHMWPLAKWNLFHHIILWEFFLYLLTCLRIAAKRIWTKQTGKSHSLEYSGAAI